MKIALYIEDGLEQVVLTPESETERSILNKIHDRSRELQIKRGAFYGCMGGWKRWKRWKQSYTGPFSSFDNKEDESTMIVLRPAARSDAEHGGAHMGHDGANLAGIIDGIA
jgi:hypothetical protein